MRATPVWRGALTYDSLHSRLVTHARCIEMFHLSIMFIVVIQHHYRLIYPNLRLRNVVWLHFFMHKSSFTAQFWCILAAIGIILVADPDCRAHIVSHIPSVLRGASWHAGSASRPDGRGDARKEGLPPIFKHIMWSLLATVVLGNGLTTPKIITRKPKKTESKYPYFEWPEIHCKFVHTVG